MLTLRPYQQRVLDDLWRWFESNGDGDPVIEACVGAGKSVLIAELCRRAIAQHADTRILMLVHSKELIEQNLAKLLQVWPGAPVGAYSASLGARQLGRAVTYATIGSVARRAHELGHLDLVLVDECFVAGTLVETPNGSSPIELIKPGDLVFNAAGIGTVQAIRSIESEDLYDVSTDDGNVITCTGNHPFFTERGFVRASALERGAHLYSPQAVRALWRGVQAVQDDERGCVAEAALLLNLLLQETREPDAYRECAYRHEPEAAGDQAPAIGTSRKWLPAHIDGAWTAFPVGQRLDVEYADHDWHAGRQRISAALQAGHQQSGTEDLHRGGRELSCFPQGGGREEAAVPGVARVARVSRHRCEGARTVFNLQVCGHPSYFAGGYLVHNCHLIGPSETTQYRRLIDALRQICPALRVVGWTGTAFRGDGVWLTQQGLFTHVAARVTMAELLRDGYLAPLVTQETATHIDTAGVRTQGGDYVVSALARATDRAELVQAACAELVRLAAERRRWLVFAVTVEHAEHLAAELRTAHGIDCAVVSAETQKAERERLIRAFRTGRLRALVNVAVLTTGFDAPELDCIALLRATQSPVLYVQIAGRGMRTAPAKSNCLWLDFTATTASLGPVDAIKGRNKPPAMGGGPAPCKYCDECGNPNATAVLACVHCGHLFPPPERIKHEARADTTAAVLSTGPEWYSVTRVAYGHHPGRDGKPDSLRVDYWSGLRRVASEWVCLEHTGYPRMKASRWWMTRSDAAPPDSVGEALDRLAELREPGRIAVQMDGKYATVVSAQFAQAKEAA